MAPAMATARCVRRASPRCTLPKVSSAHCRADNMLLAFIIAAPSLERFFILPGGILPPLDEKLVINSQGQRKGKPYILYPDAHNTYTITPQQEAALLRGYLDL